MLERLPVYESLQAKCTEDDHRCNGFLPAKFCLIAERLQSYLLGKRKRVLCNLIVERFCPVLSWHAPHLSIYLTLFSERLRSDLNRVDCCEDRCKSIPFRSGHGKTCVRVGSIKRRTPYKTVV